MRVRMLSVAAVLLATGAAASAQSITTGFAGTTILAGGPYNGNFFDVTVVNPGGITINSWEINSSAAANTIISVQIWYKEGTWVGFHSNQAAWTMLGEIPVTAAGPGNPTVVNLGGLNVPSGQTYGIRIGTEPGALRYVSATSNTIVYNNDVALELGAAQGAIFGTSVTQPRWWNGTIHYTAHGVTPQGRCCLPTGLCEVGTQFACTQLGGVYAGDNTDCAGFTCPQPPTGACCSPGGCVVVSVFDCVASGGVYNGDNTSCVAGACDIYKFEVEPNNTKLEASLMLLEPGQAIVGVSTASTGTADPASPDYFLVQTASAPPGIYRHRLTLSNAETVGNSAWIRGLTQTGAAAGPWPGPVGTATATESTGQAHQLVGTDRINIWYGFGKQEQVYYRVSGVASTTGVYVATFDSAPVVPTDLGNFNAGGIIIDTGGQGHSNDTHVRIWDSNFNPLHGYANDGASINGGAPANLTTTSYLLREYTAGTYYMGIAMGNLATNQGSPCDDNVRTGPMMDFADVAVDTGAQTVTDVSFSITDSASTTPFMASRGGRGEIAWFRFTVTGTIATGACCFASGACDVLTSTNCLAQGGTYQGDETNCTVNPCPQPPTGACCFNDGTCAIDWSGGCTAAGGTYMGDNTACGTVVCPTRLVTGLPNNGLSAAGSGIFLDLSPRGGVPLMVPRLDYVASAAAGTATTIEIWTYPGAYLPQYASSAGWTLHDTVNSISAGSSDLAPLLLNNPLILPANQTTGVYLIAQAGGVRYTGATGAQPVWEDANLTLYSEHARTLPWAGTINAPRVFSGVVYYTLGGPAPCYANCDNSTTPPILNVEDFSCFINEFASASVLPHEQQLTHYANCDQSTTPPVLNVEDFSCFINKFAQGCP
jgi:hypothetical protein